MERLIRALTAAGQACRPQQRKDNTMRTNILTIGTLGLAGLVAAA